MRTPLSFRFSLASLLVMVLIVAVGLAFVGTTRELRRVRDENARLRTEAGYLSLEDKDRISAIHIPALDELTWRWRVYLPKGKWTFHAITDGIPASGLPSPNVGAQSRMGHIEGGIPGKTSRVDLSLRKGAQGQWQVLVLVDGGGMRRSIKAGHPMTAAGPSYSASMAGASKEELFEPGEPAVLLRMRASSASRTLQIPDGPAKGLMLWIEPGEP